MASAESSSVPARLKDLKDLVKERFLGLLGIRQQKVLLEDEQEVFLQVGRTVWHASRQLRIELWLSSLARRHSLVSEYQTYLAQDIAREASIDIEKDVQRTFPNTRRFHAEEGQTQLRNVLRAYAAYDPEVAYCQGMNFLTGLLLMYLPSEAHAFAALVVLMEDRKLRSFYHRSMALLQVQLWQLSRLISPSLNQHLEGLGVVPMLYGASWLMTAFSADFPIPFSARIMDVLLADQCECALLKVSAAIMKAVEPRLKEMHDLENVLGHLKIEVPAWEEEELHDVLTAAFTKPWTSRQLAILRSTEGAETVAQAMDRVMTMNEQLTAPTCDEEEGGEDNDLADARVAVPIPRLQPPPQPSNSFSASPACGTPINGGMYGTGSHGGASGSPPYAAATAAAAAAVTAGKCSSSGGFASASASDGGGLGGGVSGGGALTAFPGSSGGSVSSPAVWAIPCIHPNVPASPAIQAFRRAHLPSFQAAVAAGAAAAVAQNGSLPGAHPLAGPPRPHRLSSSGSGGLPGEGRPTSTASDSIARDPGDTSDLWVSDPHGEGGPEGRPGSGEEWGEFNAAAIKRQWRSILRAAPGSTRHVLMHPADEGAVAAAPATNAAAANGGGNSSADTREGPWHESASAALAAATSSGGQGAAGASGRCEGPDFGGSSQPIPVPGSSSGGGSRSGSAGLSAFANSAAAVSATAAAATGSGKPPLPPRCNSIERGPTWTVGVPYSRLSVVAEDPLAVQMGPAAPAPSPRGSMDLYVLGRSGSQILDGCEHHGLLLCGGSLGAGGNGGGAGSAAIAGSASANGDCASGSASATTAGVLLSPSGISGAMSPHVASPKVVLSGWRVSAGGAHSAGGGAGGAGSDTPTGVYVPLGMERLGSESWNDVMAGVHVSDRGVSMALPLLVPPVVVPPLGAAMAAGGADAPLLLPPHQLSSPKYDTAAERQHQQQPVDMATDIAGDILRMLSAVDAGNANAAYDPRAVLGESMYADSPSKEESNLVRRGSEALRHLPSSSALAELAAQDMAKAQEEAERVRQELEAQLAQQKAAERASCAGAAPQAEAAEAAVPAAEGHALEGQAAATGAVSSQALADPAVFSGGAAPGPASAGTAAAPAGADAQASAGGGGGPEELVFKRPTLYVDGIPMFDPKSLMCDSSEAQIMFTPTVSPGASSYADPLLAAFTPTAGDLDTPADHPDHATPREAGTPSDATTAAVKGSDFEGDCDASANDAAGSVAPSERPSTAVGVSSHAGLPTAVEGPVRPDRPAGMAAAAGESLSRSPSGGGAVGGSGGLTRLPPAAEWVDWSQAPPIQSITSVVLSVSELAELGAAGEYASPGKLKPVPSESGSDYESDTDRSESCSSESSEDEDDHLPHVGPVTDTLFSRSLGGQPGLVGTAGFDLIDMTSPARLMLPAGLPAEASFASMSTAGTGLSPVPGPPANHHHYHHYSHSPRGEPAAAQLATDSESCEGSFVQQFPYGLLPMTSNISAGGPPPLSLSFSSTVSAVSAAGSSFTGPAAAAAAVAATATSGSAATLATRMFRARQQLVPDGGAHAAESATRTGHGVATAVSPAATPPQSPPVQSVVPNAAGPSAGESSWPGGVSDGAVNPASELPSGPDVAFAETAAGAPGSPAAGAVPSSSLSPEAAEPSSPPFATEPTTGGSASTASRADMAMEEEELPRTPFVAQAVRPQNECVSEPTQGVTRQGSEAEKAVKDEATAGVQVSATPSASDGDGATLEAEPSVAYGVSEITRTGSDRPLGRGHTGSSTPVGMENQGSTEMEAAEGEEVENSPYRAALSPSLAHHIMSAYLRSEQHQQQQEQRELQERLMMGHPRCGDSTTDPTGTSPTSDITSAADGTAPASAFDSGTFDNGTAASALMSGHTGVAFVGHVGGLDGYAVGTSAHDVHPSLQPLGAPPGPASAGGILLSGDLSLCPPSRGAGTSGLASPVLGSPNRALGHAGLHPLPPAATAIVHKALTPFAVSLDDPTTCRLSAELLQSMPPPPVLAIATGPLDTPNPSLALSGAGSGLSGHDGRTLGGAGHPVTSATRGSLRCTHSGEGGDPALPAAGGDIGGLGGSIGGSLRPSGGGAFQHPLPASLHPHSVVSFGSHDLPVLAGGIGVTPPPSAAAEARGSSMSSASAGGCVHTQPPPLLNHSCSARVFSSSNGGAVPPLLPPPPPPQVPLCQAATLAAAAAAATAAAATAAVPRTECASAPVIGAPCTSASQAPLPPVLCSSSATVLCVNASNAAAACTPAVASGGGGGGCAAAGAATSLPPAPPAWTATFDGVDDSPSCVDGQTGDQGVGQPRTLASAFAAEATRPALGDGSSGGALTPQPLAPPPTGLSLPGTDRWSTPEARL